VKGFLQFAAGNGVEVDHFFGLVVLVLGLFNRPCFGVLGFVFLLRIFGGFDIRELLFLSCFDFGEGEVTDIIDSLVVVVGC
jgi:hypothetical protein